MTNKFIPFVGHAANQRRRATFSDWISRSDFEWFVTLNFNGEKTIAGARHDFQQWLARLDREFLGHNWCRRADKRTFAIGIVENPWTNLHIHALVKLPARASALPPPSQSEIMQRHWRKLRPSGSSDRQRIYDLERLAGYMTKQITNKDRFDSCIIYSPEFHNYNEHNQIILN
jgi:hypothetical protein